MEKLSSPDFVCVDECSQELSSLVDLAGKDVMEESLTATARPFSRLMASNHCKAVSTYYYTSVFPNV